jgi:hypothetical protein
MNPLPDMGERALIAVALRSITLLIAVLILSITSCTWHADYQAVRALREGVDPLGVACALSNSSEAGECALAAAGRAK